MIVRLGWAGGSYGAVQFLRLVNNVVLARLLAPQLFGIMLVVNSVKTGIELLSDVGITQNVVRNRRGDDPVFYNTAWTIQFLRGLVLALIALALTYPLSLFFELPLLNAILPVIGMTFLFTGVQATSRGLLERRQQIAHIAICDVIVAALILAAYVALAIITPTIWALVLGGVIASAVTLVASYLLIPGHIHRFTLDRDSVREVFHFGKWIFASSVIYFAAMNFDRLYFAKQISFAELGVYAIARSIADMISNFVIHAGNLLIFPTVAASNAPAHELRSKLLRGRRTMLLLAAVGLGAFTSCSDFLVSLLYDDRYQYARTIVPILLLGVWFAVLSSVNESILLGTGRSAYTAFANATKLLTYVVGMPLAFHWFGFNVAILVLSAGEAVRYVVLWLMSRGQHLGFAREDAPLTIIFVLSILLFRELLHRIGLTEGVESLFPLLRPEFWAR